MANRPSAPRLYLFVETFTLICPSETFQGREEAISLQSDCRGALIELNTSERRRK